MWETVAAEFTPLLSEVSWQIAILRLGAAVVLGGIIGWEREVHSKPAGLRTHMAVALGACMFTLLGFEIVAESANGGDHVRADPVRIIEAVTAGVAFLAAGTIFTAHDRVKGLTTGAGMWLAGAIGVACGLGQLTLAAVASVLTLFVLWALRAAFSDPSPKKEPRD
jgi:putative Mg2+ transporter-C (MgtC) family protein